MAEFQKDKEGWTKKFKGPKMDDYASVMMLVNGTDAGALMRRLDDGKNTKDGKPGNMYNFLGNNAHERAARLETMKKWVGGWSLKRRKSSLTPSWRRSPPRVVRSTVEACSARRRSTTSTSSSQVQLVSPEALHDEPLSEAARRTVLAGRDTIKRILERADPRLFLVVGPCSIHDPQAALDYGRRLAALAREVEDTFFVVMRVYFEKPRTTVGWKGSSTTPTSTTPFI